MESVSTKVSGPDHFPFSKPRAPQIFWRKREECFVLTGEPKKGLALRAQGSFLGQAPEVGSLVYIFQFAPSPRGDGGTVSNVP
jgi:hypothetical protein